jgi:hypothetical protein
MERDTCTGRDAFSHGGSHQQSMPPVVWAAFSLYRANVHDITVFISNVTSALFVRFSAILSARDYRQLTPREGYLLTAFASTV